MAAGSDGTRPAGERLRAVSTASLPTAGSYFAAAGWHNLAALLSDQGRLPAAHTAAHQAIAAWRQLHDRYCEVTMLNNLAVLHSREGDHQGAVAIFRECVDAADVLPRSLRARCVVSLAAAHAQLGQVDEAENLLEVANALSSAQPNPVGAHLRLTVEILILRKTGRIDDATTAAKNAMTLAQDVDSRRVTTKAASRWSESSEKLDSTARPLPRKPCSLCCGIATVISRCTPRRWPNSDTPTTTPSEIFNTRHAWPRSHDSSRLPGSVTVSGPRPC